MNRSLYVIALALGSMLMLAACNNGGSSSSTPTCSVGASASGCSCPSGTTNLSGYCQSTGAYGAYGSTGYGGYGGCMPCSNLYNGQQGIQTQLGCATPIQQNNGTCLGILPGGQVAQGIPMQGYSGYPTNTGYGGGYGGGYYYGTTGYYPQTYPYSGYYPTYYRAR